MKAVVLILILSCTTLQVQPSQGESSNLGESLKNLSPESKRRLAEKIRETLVKAARPRQEDEDEEGSTNLLPQILKVVGSALSLNASGLIENSHGLLPATAQNFISGTLTVLANALESASNPTTKSPVKSSAAPSVSEAPPAVKQTTPAATTVASTSTTDEDDDSDEDLRSNSTVSSTTLRAAVPSSSAPAPTTVSAATKSNQGAEDAVVKGITDIDNKANWESLILKSNEAQQNPTNPSPSKNIVSSFNYVSTGAPPLIEKREDNSTQVAAVMKIMNENLPFAQKLNSLLSINKPDLVKYNPELANVLHVMKFLMENNEVLKANTNGGSPSTSHPQTTVPTGLFAAITNLNYANKFKYGQSSTASSAVASQASISTGSTPKIAESTTETSEVETTTEDDDDDEDEDENRRKV